MSDRTELRRDEAPRTRRHEHDHGDAPEESGPERSDERDHLDPNGRVPKDLDEPDDGIPHKTIQHVGPFLLHGDHGGAGSEPSARLAESPGAACDDGDGTEIDERLSSAQPIGG